MPVAKGQVQPDKSYRYRCGKCSGSGRVSSGICPHCYRLDLKLLHEQFQTAQGERYYALLKAILSVQGKAIYDRAMELQQKDGVSTPLHLGILCIEFGFNSRMKPLVEWLEECRLLPSGIYVDLRERGMRVGAVLAKAQAALDAGKYQHPVVDPISSRSGTMQCEYDGCPEEASAYTLHGVGEQGEDETHIFCIEHARDFGFCPGCGWFALGADDDFMVRHGLCSDCYDGVRADMGEFDDPDDEVFVY